MTSLTSEYIGGLSGAEGQAAFRNLMVISTIGNRGSPRQCRRATVICGSKQSRARMDTGSGRFNAQQDALGRVTVTGVGIVADAAWDQSTALRPDPPAPTEVTLVSRNIYFNAPYYNGQLQSTTLIPGGEDPDRVTKFTYDWRGRVVKTTRPDGALVVDDYDAFGRVVKETLTAPDPAHLGFTNAAYIIWSQTVYKYDSRGQLMESDVVSPDDLNPKGSTPGKSTEQAAKMVTKYAYDGRGDAIRTDSPGNVYQSAHYNGLGQVTEQYTGRRAMVGADDRWLERTTTTATYSAAGPTTVARTTLRSTDPSLPDRTTWVKGEYDWQGRLIRTTDYGTVNPYETPAPSDPAPIVTRHEYDDAGFTRTDIDPREIKTQYTLDALGRTVKIVEALQGNGTPGNNSNRTTTYKYFGTIGILEEAHMVPGGDPTVTTYTYAARPKENSVASTNDLVSKIEIQGGSSSGDLDVQTLGYNALGETRRTWHNTIVHELTHDSLGRLVGDHASVDGATPRNIDTTVDTLTYHYNPLNLLTAAETGGGQMWFSTLRRTYNGWGQLKTETSEDRDLCRCRRCRARSR